MNLPIPFEVQLESGDWFWMMDYYPLPGVGVLVQVGWSGGDPRHPAFSR